MLLHTKARMAYKAFGLTIICDIPLPELTVIENERSSIDLDIVFDDLATLWAELSNPRSAFVIKKDFVMFQVPYIATFLIEKGNKIIVSPLGQYDEDIVRLYLLGTCMGAVLLQRKIYPLHGSAIAIDGKAYAIIGESGAGKSTLASAFLQEGFQLLTDDVIAISLSDEDSNPIVYPAYPQQKLWLESLNNFGMNSKKYRSIHGRETKYNVPVIAKYHEKPLQLAGIFELMKSENNEIQLTKIESLDRLTLLFSNTFRNFFINGLELMDWHFQISSKIAAKIQIYRLKRPKDQFTAPQLVSTILNVINKGE